MPNRTEAARRKPSHLPTGRLQPLRLFSTPLPITLIEGVGSPDGVNGCNACSRQSTWHFS